MNSALLPTKTRKLFDRETRIKQDLEKVFNVNVQLSLEEAMGFTSLSRPITNSSAVGMTITETVVQRIRAARTMQGLTQQELAEISGIKRANIARIEAGKHAPRVDTIELLARALAISLTELFETGEAALKLRRLNESRARAGVATLRENLKLLRQKGIIDKKGKRVREELPPEMKEGTSDAV